MLVRSKEPVKYKEDRVRAQLERTAEAEVCLGFELQCAKACCLESARIWASWPILRLGKLRQVDNRKFEATEATITT